MHKKEAVVKVIGIRPLLWHTFPIDALSATKKKAGTKGQDNDEWKETVLMNESRQLYVFNSYFQASISKGGKEIKSGRGSIHKKVAATLEVKEPRILMDGLFVPSEENLTRLDSDPVYLDVRSVVNPMTKGRNVRYRIAAKTGWTCSFTVCWDERIISKEQIKLCIEHGGAMSGVGDGREIGFGRYEMVSITFIS